MALAAEAYAMYGTTSAEYRTEEEVNDQLQNFFPHT